MADQETGQTNSAESNTAPLLAKTREYMIQANPDVVPELVAGNSIEELEQSLETARAAHKRIVAAVTPAAAAGAAAVTQQQDQAQASTQPVIRTAPQVPAGGTTAAVDLATLSSQELIHRGIEERRRK